MAAWLMVDPKREIMYNVNVHDAALAISMPSFPCAPNLVEGGKNNGK